MNTNTNKHTSMCLARRMAVTALVLVMCFACVMPLTGSADVYAASPSTKAAGRIDADGGAYLRKTASASSAKLALLPDNTAISITREVFTARSTKLANRWYYVYAAGKSGYVRADLVDSLTYANVSSKTTAKINYRTGPTTKMAKKGSLKKGAKVTVLCAARFKGSKTNWYRVKVSGKAYYVSASYVKLGSKAATTASASAAATTVQKGVTVSGARVPTCIEKGKGFTIRGVLKSTDTITSVRIGAIDASGKWIISETYSPNAKTFDILDADKDITFGKLPLGKYTYRVDATSDGKTRTVLSSKFEITTNALKAGLLGNPTDGGKARYVYTFDTTNCSKVFAITGFSKAIVPQGMTFTGSEYYIVYGMKPAQAIVTYSAAGEKIKSGGFAFNMGHPNGITWDPRTGLCYIFKGNQKTIYTWNPKTNKYGKAKTPYSSSGVAYDSSTGVIYATSQTGIRQYSADGKFRHQKLFKRCSHGIKHYIQDCGAGGGFIFHGISGSNKQKTNFLDVYRASDSKYLGSIRIAIGEVESAVVGNDGYVQLLINTPGKTDYIWKTPLNINDLK